MRGLRWNWRLGLVLLLTAFTLSLHYMVLPFPHWVHLVHRRLCYVPILLGGLWFGTRGGLGFGLLISAATLPLALRHSGPIWDNQDLIEIVFYVGLGLMAGFLVDRKEAERSRALDLSLRLQASERMASMGRMASGVAHEVRTPLGAIQGAAEILGEDFPEGHPRRPFFEILLEEIGRLKRVVEDFLDLGRPIPLNPRPVALAEAVREVFQSLGPEAARVGVELHNHAQEEAVVRADPLRLHQALANLVLNGLQASPSGGSLTVRTEGAPGFWTVLVEDEGPGLPPGEEGRIFEPFFTRRKEGTGLGLALVKQIAQAHGGSVEGRNRPGGGSVFALALPVSDAPLEGGSRA